MVQYSYTHMYIRILGYACKFIDLAFCSFDACEYDGMAKASV